MKCRIMWHFIRLFTVCQITPLGVSLHAGSFFQFQPFQKNLSGIPSVIVSVIVSTSFTPIQAQHFDGPGLGPNCKPSSSRRQRSSLPGKKVKGSCTCTRPCFVVPAWEKVECSCTYE